MTQESLVHAAPVLDREASPALPSDAKHTPGPWRWELNIKHKSLQLSGGNPRYDLAVMDFVRWGMGGASPRFLRAARPGLMLLHDARDFAQIVPGREHHSNWFQTIDHPDARLIAAAPELLEALKFVMSAHGEQLHDAFDAARAAIAKAEGRS